MMHPVLPAARPLREPQTRERLLKAAKALFVLKGLAAVTVEEICLAADVSKGGFYHHFPDKESAFLVVSLEELEREMGLPAGPAPDSPGGRAASALLLDLWAWGPRRPRARRLTRAAHRRALRRLLKLPRGQAALGSPSTGDREAQAALTLLLGIGRVVQRATARHLPSSEREQRMSAAG
jgi:AcrR family transcriptional regulator